MPSSKLRTFTLWPKYHKMADQQFCEDCFKGFVHDGTPTGSIEIISDVEVYVSKPAGDYAKDKAVILASGGIVLMYPPRVNVSNNNPQTLADLLL